MPARSARPPGNQYRADRNRQLAVTIGLLVALAGALLGNGALGNEPVSRANGGAFAVDATLLSPGEPAFRIWPLIYLLLSAYTIWQWLPANWHNGRARRTGWWLAGAMFLTGVWTVFALLNWLWPAAAVLILIPVLTGLGMVHLGRPRNYLERGIVDVPASLLLGWTAVASVPNVAIAMLRSGFRVGPFAERAIAIGVLVFVLGLGMVLIRALRGRFAITLAMLWGLFWIGWERLYGSPLAPTVAVAAGVVSVLLLLATAVYRLRLRQRKREELTPLF